MATFINNSTQDFKGALALTFTIPVEAVADDLILVFVKQSENTAQQFWDDDGGGGRGYIRLAYNRSTGGRDQETAVYYKIHSGSETNPTFTWNTAGTTEQMSGSMLIYRGVDTLTPIETIGFLFATNDGNPPNPTVIVGNSNSTVVVLHAATHDDISGAFPPTGFVMRSQVYGGFAQHTADHRDHFVADISGINAGAYTPPDWQHTVANTTPEYHTYSIVLNEIQLIGVTGFDTKLQWGSVNKVITGFGFGASQGIGKVEYWSDLVGTIKSVQTIDSWSDTSIQFDTVQGGLLNNVNNFLVVTNNNGDVSGAKTVGFGIPIYTQAIINIKPDHLWTLDGVYTDSGVGGAIRDMVQTPIGTHPFVSAIAEDATQAMQFNDVLNRRECPDSPFMNVTIDSAERTVAGWIQLGGIQKSMGAIWKEGGGVQNLAFLTGLGNVLMAQGADNPSSALNAQAVANIKLTPLRSYHIALRYSLTETPKELRLFLDGIEQSLALTNGNPLGAGAFNAHSGDVTWGDPDTNLETGGTDIAYAGQENCVYQHWCSWSDNSLNTGAIEKLTEIRDVLFRRGAIPTHVISSDTPVNMQIALDALGTLEVIDSPLGIRIEASTTNDLTLTTIGVTFNARVSENLEWRGIGTLTWIVGAGSEIDESKMFSTGGGLIVVQRPATFTIAGIVNGAEIRIYDDEIIADGSFNTELAGVESNLGTSFQFSHDGTVNTIIVQHIVNGFVEINTLFTLSSIDQTLTLLPQVETND